MVKNLYIFIPYFFYTGIKCFLLTEYFHNTYWTYTVCTVYIQNLSTFYLFIKKLFKVNMLLFLSTYYYFLLFSSLGYTQLGRYLWYEIPYPIIASCVQVGKKGKGCYKKGVKFEGLLQYWVWRCMLNPYNYPLRFVFSPRVRKIFANFHHYLRNAIF